MKIALQGAGRTNPEKIELTKLVFVHCGICRSNRCLDAPARLKSCATRIPQVFEFSGVPGGSESRLAAVCAPMTIAVFDFFKLRPHIRTGISAHFINPSTNTARRVH
jgi:hypothetical protein